MNAQDESHDLLVFGARLREARRQIGMSQADFAAIAGVHLNSQSKYERGQVEPGATYFLRIADTGVDVAWLLTGRRSEASLSKADSDMLDVTRRLGTDQAAALQAFLATL